MTNDDLDVLEEVREHIARNRRNATMSPPSIFDKLGNKPPCADTLGWELIAFDRAEQWARIRLIGRDQFRNPAGGVQGGFLSAMLDEAMGSAVIIATDGAFLCTTISLSVDFVKPARASRFIGEGRVTSLGKSVAFLEGRLFDEEGTLVARATSSARLTAIDPSWLSYDSE